MALRVVDLVTVPLPLVALQVTLYSPMMSTVTMIVLSVPLTTRSEKGIIMLSSSTTVQSIVALLVAKQMKLATLCTSTILAMGGVTTGKGTRGEEIEDVESK